MRVFPLLSAVLLFFTNPPQADLSLKRSLDSFDAVVEKLHSNYRHHRELATRLDELSRKARELRRAGIASPESLPSDIYIESLNADVALLTRLTPDSPLSEISGTVEEVLLDLKLKVKFSGVARGSPYELIEVVAHTIEQGAEVGGYEIWYVPRGWAKTKGKERRFDHLSPSRMNLAPGNFVIWAQRNGVASERVPLTLGDDKRSTRDIQISVR